MTDEEFIGYCRIHSDTELALFNGPQVARMIRLAGEPEELATVWESRGSQYWRSLDLSDLCDKASLRAVTQEHDHDR